jgi:hypothetical protein
VHLADVQLAPVSVGLKFGFLAILYLFLMWVARSSWRDLRWRGDYEEVVEEPDEPVHSAGHGDGAAQRILEVVAAMGVEPGHRFRLGDSASIGRAASADIPIDDPYASSSHARIFARGGGTYIEDMGSTNGTYLNGRPLRRAERLEAGDTIRIGDSEYRYRE